MLNDEDDITMLEADAYYNAAIESFDQTVKVHGGEESNHKVIRHALVGGWNCATIKGHRWTGRTLTHTSWKDNGQKRTKPWGNRLDKRGVYA